MRTGPGPQFRALIPAGGQGLGTWSVEAIVDFTSEGGHGLQGGGEVAGDGFGDLVGPIACRALQPTREAGMQPGTLGAGEAGIARVAQQGVAEGESVADHRLYEWAGDQVTASERFQALLDAERFPGR